MRLLLLADLHLGARFAEGEGRVPDRGAGRLRAWTGAVELALEAPHRIDAVISAGDLFDHPSPPADLVARVAEGAEALLGAGKPVIFLPGAYDGLTQPTGVYSTRSFPDAVRIVDWVEPARIEIPIGSELLHLYTAAARPGSNGLDATRFRREPVDGVHAGLLHGVVGKARPEDPPCLWGRRELPEPFFAGGELDLFVLGGGHDYFATRLGRTLVVQPGAQHGSTSDDPDHAGFLVADLGPRGAQVSREAPAGARRTSTRAGASVGPARQRRTIAEGSAYNVDENLMASLRAEDSVLGLFVRRLEARCREAEGSEREPIARALALGVATRQRVEAAHVG